MTETRHPDTVMLDGKKLREHIVNSRFMLYYGGFITDSECVKVDKRIEKWLRDQSIKNPIQHTKNQQRNEQLEGIKTPLGTL